MIALKRFSTGNSLLLLMVMILAIPQYSSATGLDSGVHSSTAIASVCIPEENPVIVPGPLGSPMRIIHSATDEYLIADYGQQAVLKVSSQTLQTPELFFRVAGLPLSIAHIEGRKRPVYMVGNDQEKTIDVYEAKKNGIKLKKQLFKNTGIQAFDIEVVEAIQRVFIVDGLSGEVKALDYSGRLVGSFGGAGQLQDPRAITVDEAAGEVVVSDYGKPLAGIEASLQVFDLSGNHLETISGDGIFSRPQGLIASGGHIFFTDAIRGQLIDYDRTMGVQAGTYGCFGTAEGHLLIPMDVVFDTTAQAFYVADNRNGRITVLPKNQ